MACFWNTHRYTYILYQLKYLNTAKESIAYILFKSLNSLYVPSNLLLFFFYSVYKILSVTVEARKVYVYDNMYATNLYCALF